MEEITMFVSIVIIVFGVLQIILFFKLWGMTNDVERIKNKLNIDPTIDIRVYLLKKDYEGAYNAIYESFIKEVAKKRDIYTSWKSFKTPYNSLINLYKPWFEKVDRISGIKRTPNFEEVINEVTFKNV